MLTLSKPPKSAKFGLFAIALGLLALPAMPAPTFAQTQASPALSTSQTTVNRESFRVTSSDGTSLAVTAQGAPGAPEILLIHGLRQSHLSWEKQLNDPSLSGFRIVTFDLRGHGNSDKPVTLDAYSDANRWAEDVQAVIKGAKLRRPVLVGWSLGGYVVGAYLQKYGGSALAGIDLVDPVSNLSPDLFYKETIDFIATTTSKNLETRAVATADFLAACFHQAPTPAEMREMLVINGMTEPAVYEGVLKTETTNLEPYFAAFKGPILLSQGRHDRLVKMDMIERLKAVAPDSEISVFENSGHSPFFEEPARFNAELASFVTRANAR
ncbi:alpha/beta fold hydrolase [Thalassospira marina]|nr:alpha/beta hydrolase [Thalassospira marina]